MPYASGKITAHLRVDVSRHVNTGGALRSQADRDAWAVLAEAGDLRPYTIHLDIGAAKWCFGSFVPQLVDAGILNAAAIEVHGSNPHGIKAVTTGLRLAAKDNTQRRAA